MTDKNKLMGIDVYTGEEYTDKQIIDMEVDSLSKRRMRKILKRYMRREMKSKRKRKDVRVLEKALGVVKRLQAKQDPNMTKILFKTRGMLHILIGYIDPEEEVK